MAETDKPKELFDRQRRRMTKQRAFNRCNGEEFCSQFMAEDLIDRLEMVSRTFERCLIVGSAPNILIEYLKSKNVVFILSGQIALPQSSYLNVRCDEDRLPFADHSFDLIISVGTLDTVNDLPGALILFKKILVPDGLLLAAFIGAESLPVLKSVLMSAEEDSIAAHIHPQIDVRTAGDLLTRTGFALPVADSYSLNLKYPSFGSLINDIRNFGGSNILKNSTTKISKPVFQRTKTLFENQAGTDRKTTEKIEIIYLCGWSPHHDQPAPAKRGSGQASLKSALDSPGR